MFAAFFTIAMTAPARQISFRRVATVHVLLVTALVASVVMAFLRSGNEESLAIVSQVLLVLGIVEGAALVGWRLTQLPKSQALEFLLVSPVSPRRLFLAEASVGVGRFALIGLGGVPAMGLLLFTPIVEWPDLLVLIAMPFLWGTVVGLGVTVWVYEPILIRRIGELIGLGGVLVYLIIGVVAAENLPKWLELLPVWLGESLYNSVVFMHTMNPFGVARYWFASDRGIDLAWERLMAVNIVGVTLIALFIGRGGSRLVGHFHDRHYKPIDSSRESQSALIGDRPLSWWAVRRVMEYSGRVNLWLGGGFCLAYAAFILAGDDWPAWMGKMVFTLFEKWGGPAVVATAMTVLAAVPAAYQFGLWDSTVEARCKRLELLLLSDLTSFDYWRASLAAAWARGRGYMVAAMFLWFAVAISGRTPWYDALAAALGGGVLWAFAFAMGFRGFATGHQTNGTASLLTLGLPMILYGLREADLGTLAALVPTSATFLPLRDGISWAWLAGLLLTGSTAAVLTRHGLQTCDRDLRRWYDANQGTKAAA